MPLREGVEMHSCGKKVMPFREHKIRTFCYVARQVRYEDDLFVDFALQDQKEEGKNTLFSYLRFTESNDDDEEEDFSLGATSVNLDHPSSESQVSPDNLMPATPKVSDSPAPSNPRPSTPPSADLLAFSIEVCYYCDDYEEESKIAGRITNIDKYSISSGKVDKWLCVKCGSVYSQKGRATLVWTIDGTSFGIIPGSNESAE